MVKALIVALGLSLSFSAAAQPKSKRKVVAQEWIGSVITLIKKDGEVKERRIQVGDFLLIDEKVLDSGDKYCPAGGIRVQTRPIRNDAPGPVQHTSYYCDFVEELISYTRILPGSVCKRGGVRVAKGIDLDYDAVLSASEETHVAFRCLKTGAAIFEALEELSHP